MVMGTWYRTFARARVPPGGLRPLALRPEPPAGLPDEPAWALPSPPGTNDAPPIPPRIHAWVAFLLSSSRRWEAISWTGTSGNAQRVILDPELELMTVFPGTEAEELLDHLEWLGALARQLARDAELAEDVTQDACVIALQRRPSDPSRLRGWLAQVVRNLVRERVRGEGRRRAREQGRARDAACESTDALVERVALQRELARCVLELEEPGRSVVLLRFYAGLPPREIACRQGVSTAVVHGRLQRAVTRLRRRLDHSAGGPAAWMAVLLGPPSPTGAALSFPIGGLLVNAKIAVAAVLLLTGALVAVLVLRQGGPSAVREPALVAAAPTGPAREAAAGETQGAAVAERSARAAIQAEAAGSGPDPAGEGDTSPASNLAKERERLRSAVESSLRGDVDAGALLDLGLALVELEVGPAIPEASPTGKVRFPLEGAPEGLTAMLEVGRTTLGELVLDLRVRMDPPSEIYLVEGYPRLPAEIEISARGDSQGALRSFSLMTQLSPSGPGIRKLGIPNDQIETTDGLLYYFRADDPHNPVVRMSREHPGGRLSSEISDSWRIVGGPWPRLEDMQRFHEKLQALHASLQK